MVKNSLRPFQANARPRSHAERVFSLLTTVSAFRVLVALIPQSQEEGSRNEARQARPHSHKRSYEVGIRSKRVDLYSLLSG